MKTVNALKLANQSVLLLLLSSLNPQLSTALAGGGYTNECETVLVFGTGTSASGGLLRPGSAEPFFEGTTANFPTAGTALVPTTVPAAWQPNGASTDSQWIAPTLDPNDSPAGTYVYRLRFTTPCVGAAVNGRYAAGDRGAIRLNGAPDSFPTPTVGYTNWTAFSFSGLPVGPNTLEFHVTNAPSAAGPPGPTGLRAELTVTATCCPCIVLDCPSDIFVTTRSNSAPVYFTVSGTNHCYTNLTLTCRLGGPDGGVPVTSGSVFPVGSNLVTCTAADTVGHTTNCSFLVVVTSDTTPPQLTIPARIIVPCDGPQGAAVEFTVGALDQYDPQPILTCNPPSGSIFPSGSNMVTCTAVDAAGNRAVGQFAVIVGSGCGSNPCVEITVPADIQVPCNTAGGAIVNYPVTARDVCTGGVLTPVCNPPSGSLFPVGITRVICAVGAGASQSASSFLVEVTDIVPPVIQCPSNVVVGAQGLAGAVVTYLVSATDDCTAQPRIRCSPPSGSVFPVGDTSVLCEASDDNGNVSRCVFVVTVTPPPPLAVGQSSPTGIELRWVGVAGVQVKDTLDPDTDWSDLSARPLQSGNEWTLPLPASGITRFFRLRALPLLPPADADGDGVPDSQDHCPDTPAGLPVDEFGCALSDLVASPDKALGAEQTRLRKIRTELTRWPSTADLQPLIPDPDAPTSSLPALLFERDLPRSLMEASNVVRQLDTALMALLQTRALREMEILRAGPMFDAENADVRNEDHELMEMDRIEQSLTDSLNQHQQLFLNLSNIVRATGNVVPRQRLQIASFDTERGAAILTDGRRLLLPKPGTPGAPPLGSITDALVEGSFVDVDLSVLPDGTLYGNSAASTAGVNSSVIAQINPSRLALRVTPVDFGLPNFDLAPRHYLKAYKWGFTENLSHHYFEFGQAFAAVKLISPGGSGGNYKHWLKIDYDANNDGIYGTLMPKLDETTPPFVLKADTLPQYKAFNIRVREYRAEVVNGVPGTAEVIGEEIYLIELNPAGTYAEAFYNQTSFDLADSPSETGHRVAEVTDIARRFPLTLKPLNEMAFSGASYKANGNSSSYPNVLNIGLNDPFAVHFKDPNADLFFANPDDYDKGIYGPRLKGYNHNREFHYRVALPFIARDRLHDCSGSQPDTFYRIPLSGVYSVSQGNNGQFTHNLWQRYAWDFPKSGGTTVRAARGGTVVDMRESSSQSCWNSGAQMCQNCSGSASPNFVSIRHRDGTTAWYGHFQNNKVYVSIGQRVYRGTSLGGVGTTGCSTGNHLHFHVVNPEQTTTIPLRFESFMWPVPVFVPCYLPPSNSQGFSNNQ